MSNDCLEKALSSGDLGRLVEHNMQQARRDAIGDKPQRTKNKRRQALYGCKSNWRLMTDYGEEFVIPCRVCRSCIGNRKNDLLGRCMAHAMTCWDIWNITLTYSDALLIDGQPDGSVQRVPEHIKAFMHAIRMDGERTLGRRIDVQYFAAYEHGKLGERGHWHILVFWPSDVPSEVIQSGSHEASALAAPVPDWVPKFTTEFERDKAKYKARLNDPKLVDLRGGRNMRQKWRYWRHGLVTVESLLRVGKPDQVASGMQYAMKYAMKEGSRYLMSQAMGARFYKAWVDKHVSAGLPLHDLTYSFQGNGKLPQYRDRLKEKHAREHGGTFTAKPRMRTYQVQGVMRERMLWYAIRMYRARVKRKFKERMARTGESWKEVRSEFRQAADLSAMGSELLVFAWERKRFRTINDEGLDRLKSVFLELEISEAKDAAADSGAPGAWYDPGAWRRKNRVDADGPQYRQPIDPSSARAQRERAAIKRNKNKRKRFTAPVQKAI